MDTMLMEQRLWEYIDATCTDSERVEIDRLLKTNPTWKASYDELLRVHVLLNSADLEQPSLRFTQKVMEQIAMVHVAPGAKAYLDKKVIYGIAIFFLVMIAGLLVFGTAQADWTDTGYQGISFDISKIQWNKLFNSSYTNIFMMINVVLALVLLDKFLTSKKQHSGQK